VSSSSSSSSSYNEVKKQLEKYWLTYLKENSKRFSRSTILGASPPSVFVGQYGYPKVSIGPMVPPDIHGNTSSILDSPERWVGKTLQEILNYRLSLVRGLNSIKINDLENRFILSLHELTMSSKPAESEVDFHKIPTFNQSSLLSTTQNNNELNQEFTPFGPQAEIKSFKLSSHTSANKKIDNMYSDNTIKATDAVIDLYNNGIEISQINKVLSLGMLGRKNKRHLVPTRWSISATDDIISSYLVKKIELYQSIDKFEVIKYNHFSNYYSIIFIPSDVWSFEMVEAWYDQNNNVNKFFLESDYEDATGLDHYPKIAGAYFAAKLGVLEYLTSIKKRKCSILVFREIRPEYLVPLGVWQIREGIRDALKTKQVATPSNTTTTNSFSDFRKAILYAVEGMTVPILNWLKHSIIYKNYGKKTLISDFF
jgi:DNA repair protein NreA